MTSSLSLSVPFATSLLYLLFWFLDEERLHGRAAKITSNRVKAFPQCAK